jgi:hypothetical protein
MSVGVKLEAVCWAGSAAHRILELTNSQIQLDLAWLRLEPSTTPSLCQKSSAGAVAAVAVSLCFENCLVVFWKLLICLSTLWF